VFLRDNTAMRRSRKAAAGWIAAGLVLAVAAPPVFYGVDRVMFFHRFEAVAIGDARADVDRALGVPTHTAARVSAVMTGRVAPSGDITSLSMPTSEYDFAYRSRGTRYRAELSDWCGRIARDWFGVGLGFIEDPWPYDVIVVYDANDRVVRAARSEYGPDE
jgi:hypothetical protein